MAVSTGRKTAAEHLADAEKYLRRAMWALGVVGVVQLVALVVSLVWG